MTQREGSTRYLSDQDVAALLPPVPEQIALIDDALRAVARGAAHQPPKMPLDLGAGAAFAHAMPAAIDLAQGRVAGAKWISGGGAAGISGVVLIERTGAAGLRGIVAAAALTAARTAAVSGAALRAYPSMTARADAGGALRGAIIGGGTQAVTHRAMLAALYPTMQVAFYSRRLASELPLRDGDAVAPSADAAMRGADVIITAAAFGTAPREISSASIEPGATLLVIDYATSITGELVATLAARGPLLIVTDSAAQFDATRNAGKVGSWPAAAVQLGDAPAERAAGTTTLVNHLGIAACDIALTDLLLDRAEARSIGTLLPS